MGFDFTPKNKQAGDFQMGAFSWPWLLDAGVGLIVHIGPGPRVSQFIYKERQGSCIRHNDGVSVTAKEAKLMAIIAARVADYQDMLREQFETLTEDEKRDANTPKWRYLYVHPVREDFVKKAREFAKWAAESGGFRVD